MPYHKSNAHPTHYVTRVNNVTQDTRRSPDHVTPPPVWIPTLDLAGLNCDDEKEGHDNHANVKNKQGRFKEDENVLFIRKQKPSFVFPSESSIMNLDMMKNSSTQSKYEEDTNIISVGSYRGTKTFNDNSPINKSLSYNRNHVDENTISFSLSEANIEKYLRFDHGDFEKAHPSDMENNFNTNVDLQLREQDKSQDERRLKFREKEKTKYEQPESDGILQASQDIIDVIVVNGHSKADGESDYRDEQDDDSHVDAVYAENNTGVEKTKEKSKLRVTFSFEENRTPHGSIKRYTPIQGEANFRLQGVLKKQAPVSQIPNNQSPTSDERHKRDRFDSRPFKERSSLSNSSYHLDNHRVGLEHGIPVKHIHTTDADLEKKQSRIAATNVIHKPPAPNSTRITLSMAAEKAVSGSANRRTLTRGHNYSSNHTRGRMAYFRPADGSRSHVGSSIRSRSSEDVNYSDSKTRPHMDSPHSKSSKSRANLPFTLRRCASSDHELMMSNKQKPTKPKIAFGSFILPKEPVCQVRSTQIQFQGMSSRQSSQGGYVHTHTRRSPYAAPSPGHLFMDNQKSEISRRPGTAQNRHLSQQASSTMDLTQRHSAPSSYAPTRDKTFHNSHSMRLSINTSPARAQAMKTNVREPIKNTQAMSYNNAPRESLLIRSNMSSSSQVSKPRKTTDFDQQNRSNIAAMNVISKRDKGASHHRFVSKLRDTSKEVS